jgi:hypothetical protein
MVPPANELRRQATKLREIAPNDHAVAAVVNAFEEIDGAGGFVRHGPRETKQRPLMPEWGGKEPPEKP